ncbi:Transcription termination factor like [Melia azedarach]|uniref:Transcription termination factor like n=1 Tax=Melia azedarach TaxID=155640 RepID=A0ACC1XVM6_MELAZ|nr:Transcription termination factor like [Melia azedarach]
MQKFTSFPNFHNIPSSAIKSLFSFFSSLPETTQNPNSFLVNYLIESYSFPKSLALALSKRFSYVKSPEKPQNVCQYFRNIGFSDADIHSTIRASPQVLVCNVEKTLKPKIEFFQNLGLAGSDLGKFISKNSLLLTVSLEKKLVPGLETLKQILVDDKNNENLIRTIGRCNWLLARDPNSRFLSNVEFFKSCGIVGSQLSMLLTRQPRLFLASELKLRELVSQVSDLGIPVYSGMFVHGLYSVSCLSEETFERKLELFRSYGFSKDEFIEMFKKAPVLLRTSEEKLKFGLEFFFKKVQLEKEALFNAPICLMYSMENRVLPRYRVFKIVTSRRLLEKKLTFLKVLTLSEEEFLQKFLLRFGDDADELFLAFKGQKLGSSSSSSSEEES